MHAVAAKPSLAERFASVRQWSARLCEPLAVEDFVVQSMPDASPTRWHLAHTTWFFDTFVLAEWDPNYEPIDPRYQYLFNSYYESVGQQFPRSRRGLLTRPTVAEVFDYRRAVDEWMTRLLDRESLDPGLAEVVELGIQHEQQHQELMLTDIKHAFSCNPLHPAYQQTAPAESRVPAAGAAHRLCRRRGRRSASRTRNLPSTTNGRGTRFTCSRSSSPTGS